MDDHIYFVLTIMLCTFLILFYLRRVSRKQNRHVETHVVQSVRVDARKVVHKKKVYIAKPVVSFEYKLEMNRIPAKVLQEGLAHRRLIKVLNGALTVLPSVIAYRATLLYQEQEGCSWRDAQKFVYAFFDELHIVQSNVRLLVVDPVVTMLLLRAGYRDDALRYFCEFSGASVDEAAGAINYIQELINVNNTLFLEHKQREPDPQVLRFLLMAHQKPLAILYYRDCTDIGLMDVNAIIEKMNLDSLLTR